MDDAFTEEVDDVLEGGRFVAESDLRLLIDSFLHTGSVHGRLVRKEGPIETLQMSDEGRRELASRIAAQSRSSQTTASFLRSLERSVEIDVTFDQATALEHRDLEFVTPVHPLAREAARHWMADDDLPIARLALTSAEIASGLYMVSCEIWETIAARPDLRLVCIAAAIADGSLSPELSRDFVILLPTACDLKGHQESAEDPIAAVIERLDRYSDERRRASLRGLEATNEVVLNRRLASLNSFYESRRGRVSRELEEASEPRIVRMKTSELGRIDADYERRSTALERARRVEVLTERIAMALVEVVDGR